MQDVLRTNWNIKIKTFKNCIIIPTPKHCRNEAKGEKSAMNYYAKAIDILYEVTTHKKKLIK